MSRFVTESDQEYQILDKDGKVIEREELERRKKAKKEKETK